jgi:hypothetical protein
VVWGSAGRIPSQLVCETNLPEGRDRKIPTDLNEKTKTKPKTSHNFPYEDRDIINNPFNYTEMLEKERAPSPMRRPTGLATRIIMSNA